MKKVLLFLLFSLALVVCDQWSKVAIAQALDWGEKVVVFSWLDILLAQNRGAAFGFMRNALWANYFFTAVAILVSLVIIYLLFANHKRENIWRQAALSLILAGALGNLIDRLRQGYVTDFIALHYKNWYYPSFNVADASISVGAGLLLLAMLFDLFENNKKRL